jgi:hypothetical protein
VARKDLEFEEISGERFEKIQLEKILKKTV